MAENESLDLKSPLARRWRVARDAAGKGESSQKVGTLARKSFHGAIRKVVGQFEKYGVTTADFLANRGLPRTLSKIVKQTKGHPYAELMASVLDANPDASNTECLHRWGHAILDTVFDQMSHWLGGSEFFPSFSDTRPFFREVRNELRDDLERMAINLAENPRWKPIVRMEKGMAKADPTTELLRLLARNRDEWMRIDETARRKGYSWARLLTPARALAEQGACHASA